MWWSLYHTRAITQFQTLQRIQSIPILSQVLFYRGIDESRDRFKHFMQSEPRGKVGRFFDITRITWLCRHHIIRSSEMQKIQLRMWPKKKLYLSFCMDAFWGWIISTAKIKKSWYIHSIELNQFQRLSRFHTYNYSDKVSEKNVLSFKTVIWEGFIYFKIFVTFVLERM